MSNSKEGGENMDLLRNTTIPNFDPPFPNELIKEISGVLNKEEAPFLRHLPDNLTLSWLETTDDRLGATIFEHDHNTIARKIKQRLIRLFFVSKGLF